MEVRDSDITDEPGRTLAAEMWADMAVRYADDPAAPEPKGDTDDLRPEELSPPTGRFIVAYDGDEAVACGAFRRHDDDTAEIKRMWVRPSARGRGIARMILDELEVSAVGSGYRATVLETGVRQPEAVALYESHGYTRIPNYGFYRESLLSRCYRKQLRESDG
jgi:ribosomal protein S18 acetylase RimI-like enzyme